MPPPYLENGSLWNPPVSSGVSSPGASGASPPGSLGPGGRPGWPRGGRGRRRSPTRRSPHYTIFLTDCKEAELRDDGQKGTISAYFCGVCLLNYFFFSFSKSSVRFETNLKFVFHFRALVTTILPQVLVVKIVNLSALPPFLACCLPLSSLFLWGSLERRRRRKSSLARRAMWRADGGVASLQRGNGAER